jgi:hypothetical protein
MLGRETSKDTGVPLVQLSPEKFQGDRAEGVRRAVVQLLHRIAYGRPSGRPRQKSQSVS